MSKCFLHHTRGIHTSPSLWSEVPVLNFYKIWHVWRHQIIGAEGYHIFFLSSYWQIWRRHRTRGTAHSTSRQVYAAMECGAAVYILLFAIMPVLCLCSPCTVGLDYLQNLLIALRFVLAALWHSTMEATRYRIHLSNVSSWSCLGSIFTICILFYFFWVQSFITVQWNRHHIQSCQYTSVLVHFRQLLKNQPDKAAYLVI